MLVLVRHLFISNFPKILHINSFVFDQVINNPIKLQVELLFNFISTRAQYNTITYVSNYIYQVRKIGINLISCKLDFHKFLTRVFNVHFFKYMHYLITVSV